ncbi:MAG: hypothetical protein GEU99_15060 [Luteitalea sp.]|nr:hypothetical protein [Luteitalea sp.]
MRDALVTRSTPPLGTDETRELAARRPSGRESGCVSRNWAPAPRRQPERKRTDASARRPYRHHGRARSPNAPCLALGLLLVLSGACGSPTSRAFSSDDPVGLRIGYAEPHATSADYGPGFAFVLSLLSDARLVTTAANGRARAGLAERWEASPDGRTWRFTLKPRLRFHDGSPITAATVVRGLSSRLEAPAPLYPGLRDITKVEVLSATEFVIRLREPSWLLLEALSFEAVRGNRTAGGGAGPFRLERQEATAATLRRVDGNHRGSPAIDRITMRAYPRPRAAWAALLRGEIDLVYDVAPEALPFIERARQVQTRSFLRPYVYALGFNLRHPLLQHHDVRLALNYAVDRETVIEQAMAGRGQAASGHISPEHWAYDPGVTPFPYRPDRAAALLAKANGDRERPAFTCLVPSRDPRLERLALLLQRQLIEVGVDMDIEVLPMSAMHARLARGQFDAYLLDVAAGKDLNFPYWFWRSGDEVPLAASGYTAADAALDRLRYAQTVTSAEIAIHQFQRILHDDPPAVFLCWGETTRALSTRFTMAEGFEGDLLSMIADAHRASSQSGADGNPVGTASSP